MADWPQATNGWLMNHQSDKQLCWLPHVHPGGTELPITNSNNRSMTLQWPWDPGQAEAQALSMSTKRRHLGHQVSPA